MQTAGRILLFAFVVVAAAVNIVIFSDNINSTNTQREIIKTLRADGVNFIELRPAHARNPLVDTLTIISDRAVIQRIVDAYQNSLPCGQGDGRLDGVWQVQLTFILKDKSIVASYLCHNDYADLFFIRNSRHNKWGNVQLSEYFAAHGIAPMLLKAVNSH